ncbi:MAG: hypothetical protein LBK52_07890 [Deltaproteobacteria bacterium]|jgi:hypothetical protein|nr:hypothetical protein [Deltaproteobacteria bacterium]
MTRTKKPPYNPPKRAAKSEDLKMDSDFVPPPGFSIAAALMAGGHYGPIPGADFMVILEADRQGQFQEKKRFPLVRLGLDEYLTNDSRVEYYNSPLWGRICQLMSYVQEAQAVAAVKMSGPKDIYEGSRPGRLLLETSDQFSQDHLKFIAYQALFNDPQRDQELRPGYLFQDLSPETGSKTKLNVRKNLQPILENRQFRELLVVCQAVPDWLPKMASELLLTYKVSRLDHFVLITFRPGKEIKLPD